MIDYVHQGVFERKRAGVGDQIRGGERVVDWGTADRAMNGCRARGEEPDASPRENIDLETGLQI